MIELVKFVIFPPGISAGVRALVSMMRQYNQQLQGVWRFAWDREHGTRAYAYAAIFERGLGDYVCVVSSGGAASGYRGEGPHAYETIEEFLKTNKVEIWDETAELEREPTTHEIRQFIGENLPLKIMHQWDRIHP